MNPVERAREAVYAAQEKLDKAMNVAYSAGTITEYSKGKHWIRCRIEEIHGDRAKIIGVKSGKTYWVNGHLLLGASIYSRKP